MKCPSMKILLDHSVRQRGVVGQHGFVILEDQIADKTYRYLQPQTRHTPPRADWLQPEIESFLKSQSEYVTVSCKRSQPMSFMPKRFVPKSSRPAPTLTYSKVAR